MDIDEFKQIIYSHYEKNTRKFPWRENTSPWGVMVSEFMLQQTQVQRVVPFWERWMKHWPKVEDMAKASMKETLREWNGLGYNRRGYFLKKSAEIIARDFDGRVPGVPLSLLHLPGIGPYMAGAIPCFAYNYPAVFIETNIRSTLIHFFFPERTDVKDNELNPILNAVLDRKNPRKWYYALMDYGAMLKKNTENPGRRSAHYVRQSPFNGSFRQLRGKVLKALVSMGPSKAEEIGMISKIDGEELYKVLGILEKEAMVCETGGIYSIIN
jgi:A/G-specific adenine glycosylase